MATKYLYGEGLGKCCVLGWMRTHEKGWLPREIPFQCKGCLRQISQERDGRGNTHWKLYQNEEGAIMRCELCHAEANLKEYDTPEGEFWMCSSCQSEIVEAGMAATPTGGSYGGSR